MPQKTCRHCGKVILFPHLLQKFCNRRCQYDAHNQARRLPPELQKKPVMPKRYQRHCPFCGKVIGPASPDTKRYCSTRCEFLSRHGLHGRAGTDISEEQIERRFQAAKALIRRREAVKKTEPAA